MLKVLRSYLPFLVWLILAAFALNPPGSTAAEAGGIGGVAMGQGLLARE